MKTLYQKLKPEIKTKLKENLQKYTHGPREVIAELHRFNMYSQLKISTVKRLLLFGEVNELEWDRIDFKYGDKLFTEMGDDGEV